jgi:hypothetical protein
MFGTSTALAGGGGGGSPDVFCNGTQSTNVKHDLIVLGSAPQCVISPGVIVGHDVLVAPGGQLWDRQGQVGHDIIAVAAQSIGIGGAGTTAGGSVGHDIIIGGVTGAGPGNFNFICNTHVGHDIAVAGSASSAAPWAIGYKKIECNGGGNTIGHDLSVLGNKTQMYVANNNLTGGTPPPSAIGHDLLVLFNSPSPLVQTNTVKHDAICQSDFTTDGTSATTVAGHFNSCK